MKVGLFIPCYINAIYPNVGVASYKLLKSLGVDVDFNGPADSKEIRSKQKHGT